MPGCCCWCVGKETLAGGREGVEVWLLVVAGDREVEELGAAFGKVVEDSTIME